MGNRAMALAVAFIVLGLNTAGVLKGREESPREQDLPGVLEGIRLGMTVEELLKLRPKIELCDFGGKTKADIDLKKGCHILLEEIVNTVRYSKAAGYTIKDGCCIGFGWEEVHGASVKGDQLIPFAEARVKVLRSLVALLGSKYERKLMRKHMKAATCLAPVFLWKGKKMVVALAVTSDYPGVTFEGGLLHLSVWNAGDEATFEFEGRFEGKAAPDLLARLFAPLEKELRGEEKK